MTILYSEPVLAYNWWYWVIYLLLIVGVSLTLSLLLNRYYKLAAMCAIITLVCAITSAWLYETGEDKHETGRMKYEVILDDTYTVSELYSDYKVVEQRGQIWVIEDKEENTYYDKSKSD